MPLCRAHVLVLLLASSQFCSPSRPRRSLPENFPNSRRHPEQSESFPSPQESIALAKFDLRLQEHETDEEFPQTSHEEDRSQEYSVFAPTTERTSTIPAKSPGQTITATGIQPTDLTPTDDAWVRFSSKWDKFAGLAKQNLLSDKDKILFLSNFRKSETIAALIWPTTIIGSLLLVIMSTCLLCCCSKRPIYCLGRQISSLGRDQHSQHHKLPDIELAPIIKTPVTALTDDELERLAHILSLIHI